jgi:hypothetical protein
LNKADCIVKNRWALLLVCAGLGACGDDPASPNGISGSLGFSYTGASTAASASFSANGTIPSTVGSSSAGNDLGSGSWAAGSVSPTTNYVAVGAAIPKASASWDVTSISIARKTVGTSSVDPNCDDEAQNCTGVFVYLNFNPNGDTFSYACALTTGSVTISAISATRITGTFSGSGECFTPSGAFSSFTVSNGSFNVGVTTQLLN